MNRNLLVFTVMVVAVLFFTEHNAGAQQDPNDLGLPDSLIIETFDCDHIYQAESGSFDSVRVAVYVTHDSNTFWWEGGGKWVQDSIAAFVAYLVFWHQPPGCADSVIFPYWDNWNNTTIDPDDPIMSRSMFRHIVDTHTGDTTYNRMLQMVENGKTAWNVYTDFESHSCDGDSGRCSFACVPMSAGCQRWWEGPPDDPYGRVLLTTLTFHVYMSGACDTTEICIDTYWIVEGGITFTRTDAVVYYPQNNLPVCDTIYTASSVLCGDCSGDRMVNVADVVYLVNYLFHPLHPTPDPLCIGDVNCDGEVHIADFVHLLNYLFLEGPPPCPECCELKAKTEEFPGQKIK